MAQRESLTGISTDTPEVRAAAAEAVAGLGGVSYAPEPGQEAAPAHSNAERQIAALIESIRNSSDLSPEVQGELIADLGALIGDIQNGAIPPTQINNAIAQATGKVQQAMGNSGREAKGHAMNKLDAELQAIREEAMRDLEEIFDQYDVSEETQKAAKEYLMTMTDPNATDEEKRQAKAHFTQTAKDNGDDPKAVDDITQRVQQAAKETETARMRGDHRQSESNSVSSVIESADAAGMGIEGQRDLARAARDAARDVRGKVENTDLESLQNQSFKEQTADVKSSEDLATANDILLSLDAKEASLATNKTPSPSPQSTAEEAASISIT